MLWSSNHTQSSKQLDDTLARRIQDWLSHYALQDSVRVSSTSTVTFPAFLLRLPALGASVWRKCAHFPFSEV